jgi:hypothetical protein
MPFLQIDDFVNQSEDAVALGYRVLVETVEQIRAGYKDAQKFSKAQEDYEKGLTQTPPPIPWEEMVDRVQNIQDIGLVAIRNGTEIFLNSLKSGMTSTKRLASTWAQSREDVEASPVLAGPVFEEPIVVKGKPGDPLPEQERTIVHRGLARLRIDAVVSPAPREVKPIETTAVNENTAKPKSVESQPHIGEILGVNIEVRFEPPRPPTKLQADTSVLTVNFMTPIPSAQKPGVYDGLIRASNFELMIARLRIIVLDTSERSAKSAAKGKKKSPKIPKR